MALPELKGHIQIIVVVDWFSKRAHFITLNKNITARGTAQAFLKEVLKLHGLTKLIVLDQDIKWISKFWEGLCNLLGIKKRMSTSFHPQIETDGKS
jgi:putative transposase